MSISCPNCGKNLPTETSFNYCPNCGYYIGDTQNSNGLTVTEIINRRLLIIGKALEDAFVEDAKTFAYFMYNGGVNGDYDIVRTVANTEDALCKEYRSIDDMIVSLISDINKTKEQDILHPLRDYIIERRGMYSSIFIPAMEKDIAEKNKFRNYIFSYVYADDADEGDMRIWSLQVIYDRIFGIQNAKRSLVNHLKEFQSIGESWLKELQSMGLNQ